MSDKNSSGLFLATLVVGFFAGMILMMWVHGVIDSRVSLTKTSIAECAVKENEALRQTIGVAEYIVTFQDGEYMEIRCAKDESADQ